MRILIKRWAQLRDAKHRELPPRRRVPKTLRVRPLQRCNLLTYFKNFLNNPRPSGPAISAPRGHGSPTDAQAQSWSVYGGDAAGTRYSPATGITKANVAELRVAWTYHKESAIALAIEEHQVLPADQNRLFARAALDGPAWDATNS